MKQLRFLVMALVAMIMSVGFVACSSSDDDDNGGGGSITSEKKLVRITEAENNGSKSTITFSYNSNGQITKAGETDEYISLDWGTNSIVLSPYSKYYDDSNVDISLKDNKVTSAKDADNHTQISLNYSGNYLMSFTELDGEYEYDYKITWENGNITKIDDGQGDIRIATYYEDKVNKHPTVDIEALGLDHVIPAERGDLLYLAHPSLFGISNKNLIKSVKYTNSKTSVVNYSYELDNDGYPTKITATGIEGNNTIVYTLTWE